MIVSVVRTISLVLLSISGALLFAGAAKAIEVITGSSNSMNYQVSLVAQDLSVPWGVTFISPNQLLITQRHGEAVIIDTAGNNRTQVKGLPNVAAAGQGGLLDVVTEPGYQLPNGWLYFTYSKMLGDQAVTVLARSKLDQDTLTQWQELLVTNSATTSYRHFGSRIAFDQQGHLFFSVGDRGERPNGQDLTTHAGCILRLNMDGTVPADNPFVSTPDVLPEIWSYGHRNPQGLAFDLRNNRLWAIEHGPRGGDEINLIVKGSNYGWPVTSHGKEYWGPLSVGEATEKEGIVSPHKVYIPSIAPGSLLHYTGDAFPGWQGDLFAGALKLEHINRLSLNKDGDIISEERLVSPLKERIRALIQSPEGWIYFTTDSGNLYLISPER
ncbi:PQQ-dependent sugar dehydrogenase [Photobacterium alginatilyticum]|uniref:PQQ-dependent sugar dehydrogenase n=2 Tax=Photobacterium alginatilyticum TaxID=1775171 RepID=A0ABW9YBN2_9GAMM|nr:PQQ-dependent sugar dehydrogenase [Photobacterium alginatilyticum]NBI51157.1 PQQ-dependent sugar dehydrogenase [Photobacterium alginatilyticum]